MFITSVQHIQTWKGKKIMSCITLQLSFFHKNVLYQKLSLSFTFPYFSPPQADQKYFLPWFLPLDRLISHHSLSKYTLSYCHIPGAESRFQSFYLVIKHTKYRVIHAIRSYLERAFQVVLMVKNLPANAGDHRRHRFDPWVGKIPWSRNQQPTPTFLPGESHGQRSLLGYSPGGHRRVGHDWVIEHRKHIRQGGKDICQELC